MGGGRRGRDGVVTGLAEMKMFCVSQPDHQTVETTDPKEMGIPPGIYAGRRQMHYPEGELVLLTSCRAIWVFVSGLEEK